MMYAFVKAVPFWTRESIAGVDMAVFPRAAIVSRRWSSVKRKRMFGLVFSDLLIPKAYQEKQQMRIFSTALPGDNIRIYCLLHISYSPVTAVSPRQRSGTG
jgi:hypothetical protein